MSRAAATMFVVLGVLAAGAGAAYYTFAASRRAPEPTPEVDAAADPTVAEIAKTLTVEAQGRGVELPPEAFRKYPNYANVRFQTKLYPRDFRDGIPCPGGGFLPLLNGVPYAPALSRDLNIDGPVPPIVGKHVDREGWEWWVHEDGSTTTSRWQTIQVHGQDVRTVVTNHNTPIDSKYGLPPLPKDK